MLSHLKINLNASLLIVFCVYRNPMKSNYIKSNFFTGLVAYLMVPPADIVSYQEPALPVIFCPSPKPFHCTQLAIKGCLSRRSRRRICRERRGVLRGRREEGAAGALCCSAQSLQEEGGGTRRGQEVQEGGAVVRNRPALSHQIYLNPGHPSQCFSQLQKYRYNL